LFTTKSEGKLEIKTWSEERAAAADAPTGCQDTLLALGT